jgi:hypothetical protein
MDISSSLVIRQAVTIVAANLFLLSPAAAMTCESLISVTLPNAKVTLAQRVASGAFSTPAGAGQVNGGRGAGNGGASPDNPFKDLPDFCRVAITSTQASSILEDPEVL